MSLDSKCNKMQKITNFFTIFKNLKPKNSKTQLKKERIIKNVDELYEKYYNAYKNDYDNDNELSERKKKKNECKEFELCDKTNKELTLDGKTKKDEESKLTALPKWLHSKNDFKEAMKMIEDIRADTSNVKLSGDKKFLMI